MSFNAHGSFCWTDLIAKVPHDSKSFYSKVFGWHWEEVRVEGNEKPYYFGHWGGEGVTGLVDPEFEVPSAHWATYFYTHNLDESIQKALDLGAKTHLEKKDVPNYGAFAVLEDTSGGVFSLWNSSQEAPREAYANALPGNMCWTELMTNDIEAAGKFYCDLFNWSPAPMTTADGKDYFIFNIDERMNCGMMEIDRTTMGDCPSHWLNYVNVDSASVSLKRAEELGAKKFWGVQKMEGVGYLAVIQDPHGAVIGINGAAE